MKKSPQEDLKPGKLQVRKGVFLIESIGRKEFLSRNFVGKIAWGGGLRVGFCEG